MLLRILAALTVAFVIKKVIAFRNAANSVGNLGGYRVLFSGGNIMGRLIGRIPGISTGANSYLEDKHATHARVGCDIVANVAAFPAAPILALADAQAIKEVTTSRVRFPKPVEIYAALGFFGSNIVASEGELWKKYRKITAFSFSDRNNKLVWDETINIMNDLFDNVWGTKEVITVDHCLDITLPIALFVIGVAGFGRKMTWMDDNSIPEGHKMSFKQSLSIVSTELIPRLFLPDWAMGLTKRLRKVALGFTELKMYMSEMIDQRLKSEKVERHDLFSGLLGANDGDVSDVKLTTDELIGNIFIFLLAGHETTAHTLCFTFALLALYPKEQEKLYQHIKTVLPSPRTPTYEEMPLLTQSMAVFYETLRLFPPVPAIPKRSAEDTILTTTNAQGEKVIVPVPKGTSININVPALHYNPKYWEDPHAFKPDRFLKPDWNRDAFLPFSAGPRACLGRKFFETEGIAILTMLVSRYKITVKEEPEFAHETFDERKERLLKNKAIITTTPIRVPLVFTWRS